MYKYFFTFILIAATLSFFSKVFTSGDGVNQELITILGKETGRGSGLTAEVFNKPLLYGFSDTGDPLLNQRNMGYYTMPGGGIGDKVLILLENNSLKLTYTLPDSTSEIIDIGFWRTNKETGNIDAIVFGNQFGTYDEPRNFTFKVDPIERKLISLQYEKLLYGSGGLVFYKKK